MKLKSLLKSLSRESLRRIADFWEMKLPAELDASDTEPAVEYLYPRLQQAPHFETAFGKLSEGEVELIQFLAIHGGDLEKAEVAERLYGGDLEALSEMVHSLEAKGFVIVDRLTEDPKSPLMVGLPEPYLRFIPLPAYWEGYLGYFLKQMPIQDLRNLAINGLKLSSSMTRRDEMIHAVRQLLLTPRTLRQHIDRLSEDLRTLFQVVIERRGACLCKDLIDVGFQKRSDHGKADQINSLVTLSGLVFTAVQGANKYSSLLMVPRDIYHIVMHHFQPDRRSLRELDTVSLVSHERGPALILDNSATLLRDLVIFAAEVNRQGVKPLANGGIGKNDLKRIVPRLSRYKSQKYGNFLGLFLLRQRFLVSGGDQFRITNTFLEFLEDSRAAYEAMINWWLTTAEWNEEFVEGDMIHADVPPTSLVNIPEFRRVALKHLGDLPEDRWCAFDGFMEALNPQLQVEIPRRGTAESIERFYRSNELIAESIVTETAFWLGLTTIGLENPKDVELLGNRTGDGRIESPTGKRGRPRKQRSAPFVFRLTDVGRLVVQRAADPAATGFKIDAATAANGTLAQMVCSNSTIIVQPNFDILSPPDLNLRNFYHLNEFAEVTSVDVMTTLTLSRESLRKGMDNGLHAEDVLSFLRAATNNQLPETVVHLVQETSSKHGEVNMGYAGGYILVDDPVLMAELRSSRRLDGVIKDIIDNRVVLLNPDVNVRKVARELQKYGFMPRLASEFVHVSTEEVYHLSLGKEDMYTLLAAMRFLQSVEEVAGTTLTDNKVTPLLERLKPDPRAYAALALLADSLVKTWAKNYEDSMKARLEEVRDKYRSQMTRMVTTVAPKRTTKYAFDGPNPARDPDDIRKLIEFSIENEFEVEMLYAKADGSETTERVVPQSNEQGRIYALNRSGNTYRAYRLERVLRARLI